MKIGKPEKIVEVSEPAVPYEGDEVKREENKEREKEPVKTG